jgi:hypothetical protein
MKLLYDKGESWHEAKLTLDWYKHAETKRWLAVTVYVSCYRTHHAFTLVLRNAKAYMKGE